MIEHKNMKSIYNYIEIRLNILVERWNLLVLNLGQILVPLININRIYHKKYN